MLVALASKYCRQQVLSPPTALHCTARHGTARQCAIGTASAKYLETCSRPTTTDCWRGGSWRIRTARRSARVGISQWLVMRYTRVVLVWPIVERGRWAMIRLGLCRSRGERAGGDINMKRDDTSTSATGCQLLTLRSRSITRVTTLPSWAFRGSFRHPDSVWTLGAAFLGGPEQPTQGISCGPCGPSGFSHLGSWAGSRLCDQPGVRCSGRPAMGGGTGLLEFCLTKSLRPYSLPPASQDFLFLRSLSLTTQTFINRDTSIPRSITG